MNFCTWKFSESNEEYLRRCLEAASPPTESNKWYKAFGSKRKKLNNLQENTDKITLCDNSNNSLKVPQDTVADQPGKHEKTEIECIKSYDAILDNLENEPTHNFPIFMEKCRTDPSLIELSAKQLSHGTINKICIQLFSTENIDTTFLSKFYSMFFCSVIKREYTLFTLDLVIKALRIDSTCSRSLLVTLIKDLEIPNKVLHDCVNMFTETEKVMFMNLLTEIDVKPLEFQYHLLTILKAYRDVTKTSFVQNFMSEILTESSVICTKDKTFGKLLLCFLQQQQNIGALHNCKSMEKVIETHCTPFKKPCLNVFTDILKKYHL